MKSIIVNACLFFTICGALEQNFFFDNQDLLKLLGHNEEEFSDYEIITPRYMDSHGIPIKRMQRSTDKEHPYQVHYSMNGFGQKFDMKLQKNINLLDPNFKFTARNSNNDVTEREVPTLHDCVYQGKLTSHEGSKAALTTCDGIQGFITTPHGDYFIRPMPIHRIPKRDVNSEDFMPHVMFKIKRKDDIIYNVNVGRTPAQDVDDLFKEYAKPGGPTKQFLDQKGRPMYGKPFGDNYKGPPNAMAGEKLTIETAIFADKPLMDYITKLNPANPETEFIKYILTIMNAIQLIYNDVSYVGKPVNYIIMKVEYFTGENPFYKNDNAHWFVNLFCEWQSQQNPGDDNHEDHWDHAFFFTGIDITGGAKIIGVAPMSGMCSIRKSCTLTEASSFVAVYTGAHEAGHNFGIPHDGDKNPCDDKKFLMSPTSSGGQTAWSPCSRDYATKYLGLPWTVCLLDDRKITPKYDHIGGLPGQRFPIEAQCEILLGDGATPDANKPLESICTLLYCANGKEWDRKHPALEGTECGPGKWCKGGNCESWGSNAPKPIDGGFGDWGSYGPCISGCLKEGTSISVSTRKCNNPWPAYGGKDCVGGYSRVKTCSDSETCAETKSMFEFGQGVCFRAPPSEENYSHINGESTQDFVNDKNGGCSVMCKLRGGRPPITWGKTWPDGTDCSNNNRLSPRYCYKGKCSEPIKGYREAVEGEENNKEAENSKDIPDFEMPDNTDQGIDEVIPDYYH